MQFMVLLRRRSESYTDADFAPHAEAERQQARQLYVDSVIRQIWHRGDTGGACMLVEAASHEEVTEKLQTLPLVKADMLEIEKIVPLNPYAGFGPR
jgi:muconolactone delta-isomerase